MSYSDLAFHGPIIGRVGTNTDTARDASLFAATGDENRDTVVFLLDLQPHLKDGATHTARFSAADAREIAQFILAQTEPRP